MCMYIYVHTQNVHAAYTSRHTHIKYTSTLSSRKTHPVYVRTYIYPNMSVCICVQAWEVQGLYMCAHIYIS